MSGLRVKTTLAIAAALLLSVALPLSARADSGSRPFKGSASGEVVYTPVSAHFCPAGGGNFGLVATVSTATGTASHLGRMGMSGSHCTPSGDTFGPGTMTMTSASGDEVFMEYTGSAPFPGPGTTVIDVHIDFTIVGGTGRFATATGGGEMTAYITFEGFTNPVWPARWVWDGAILGY